MDYLEQSMAHPQFKEQLVTILAFFSPLTIIQFGGYPIFFILLMVTCVALVISKENIFLIDRLFFIIVLILLFTTILSYTNSIGSDWEKRALKGWITIAMICFIYFLISGSKNTVSYLSCFRRGLVWAINFNLFWSILQILLFQIFNIELNTLIFVNTLHMIDIESMYRGGTMVATGLHWHPGNLAPLLVLGFVMNRRLWYRFLIVIVALFSYNSTCILGVSLCIVLEVIFSILNNKNKRKRKNFSVGKMFSILLGLSLIIALLVIVNKFDFYDRFSVVISNFINKASFSGTDNSSAVHLRYYQLLPQILAHTPLIKLIFGFGYGCSGYLYTLTIGQYAELSTWAVESDFVNNVLGLGFINTVLFYLWYLSVGIKGIRINYKYFIVILTIFVQGFSYNVQFDWVILTVCMLALSVKQHRDFFSEDK